MKVAKTQLWPCHCYLVCDVMNAACMCDRCMQYVRANHFFFFSPCSSLVKSEPTCERPEEPPTPTPLPKTTTTTNKDFCCIHIERKAIHEACKLNHTRIFSVFRLPGVLACSLFINDLPRNSFTVFIVNKHTQLHCLNAMMRFSKTSKRVESLPI